LIASRSSAFFANSGSTSDGMASRGAWSVRTPSLPCRGAKPGRSVAGGVTVGEGGCDCSLTTFGSQQIRPPDLQQRSRANQPSLDSRASSDLGPSRKGRSPIGVRILTCAPPGSLNLASQKGLHIVQSPLHGSPGRQIPAHTHGILPMRAPRTIAVHTVD